jgi:hypothetical protein
MSSVPPECQALADELLQLKQERAALQQELRSLAGPEKVNATRAINGLLGQIQQKSRELDACLGRPMLRTCTLDTSGVFGGLTLALPAGSGSSRLPLGVRAVTPIFTFSGLNYAAVQLFFPTLPLGTVSSFARTFMGPVSCPYTVTVGQSAGTGSFDSPLGEVDIQLSLVFTPSPAWSGFLASAVCPLSFAPGPSTLAGTLTTRMVTSMVDPTLNFSGSPLARPSGGIRLIMTGIFSGGFLAGIACDVMIVGILSQPLP